MVAAWTGVICVNPSASTAASVDGRSGGLTACGFVCETDGPFVSLHHPSVRFHPIHRLRTAKASLGSTAAALAAGAAAAAVAMASWLAGLCVCCDCLLGEQMASYIRTPMDPIHHPQGLGCC